MSKIIEYPDKKIGRASVLEFIQSLELDLDVHHMKRLTFTPNTLFVDMAELNENGNEFKDPNNPNEVAQRTITIPIEF